MIAILFSLLFTIQSDALSIDQSIFSELSKAELDAISKNELIFKTQKINKATWPKITIYQKVMASPVQGIALFLALDEQKNFVPNMIESSPVKHVSAVEVHTKYEMNMPWPIPNTHYVHGSILLKSCKDCFSATWYKVTSDSTEKVEGRVDFIPYKTYSLMRYESFIVPSSIFAGLVKRTMFKDVRKSLVAIKAHINKTVHNKNSPLLKKYISYVYRSLNGEKVYSGFINNYHKKNK